MQEHSSLFKRAALGQVVFGIWYFGFFGVDPLQVNSVPLQITCLLFAGLLAVGSIPGMYLSRALDRVAERSARRITVVLALGLPVLALAVGARLAVDSLRIHGIEQDAISLAGLIFDVGIVVIEGVSLVVNLATLAARKQPRGQAR